MSMGESAKSGNYDVPDGLGNIAAVIKKPPLKDGISHTLCSWLTPTI